MYRGELLDMLGATEDFRNHGEITVALIDLARARKITLVDYDGVSTINIVRDLQ